MKICEYGCGKEAKYLLEFKLLEDKWCCSKTFYECTSYRKKISEANKDKKFSEERKKNISKAKKNPSEKTREKMSEANKNPSEETRRKMGPNKFTLKDYKEKYPFLFQVEDLRKDPKTGKMQAHCKHHKCSNSKEKGGWFNLTYTQLYERIRQLYHPDGWGGSYFYCSNQCKQKCDIFNLRKDPCKVENNNLPYTPGERQTLNQFVLDRDNYLCQFCGAPATDVHHERPIKLEPFFALDPDFAWSCCEKCHYEKGHKKGTKCSTGNLANKSCEGVIYG